MSSPLTLPLESKILDGSHLGLCQSEGLLHHQALNEYVCWHLPQLIPICSRFSRCRYSDCQKVIKTTAASAAQCMSANVAVVWRKHRLFRQQMLLPLRLCLAGQAAGRDSAPVPDWQSGNRRTSTPFDVVLSLPIWFRPRRKYRSDGLLEAGTRPRTGCIGGPIEAWCCTVPA